MKQRTHTATRSVRGTHSQLVSNSTVRSNIRLVGEFPMSSTAHVR